MKKKEGEKKRETERDDLPLTSVKVGKWEKGAWGVGVRGGGRQGWRGGGAELLSGAEVPSHNSWAPRRGPVGGAPLIRRSESLVQH